MSENDTPVIVAGAGPVGMTAALALRARDVPVTILEAEPEDRERPGSRAIYVHGATLHTLERNRPGLGQQLAEEGLVWPTVRTLWEGKEVYSKTYPGAGEQDGLPHFTSLPQVDTEDFLLDALKDLDVPIHWDSAVETVESTEDGVRVETENGDVFEGEFLVGADGAGSTVRKEIGVEFEGSQSENTYVIADIDEVEDNPHPKERVFHYKHPEVGGRNVLLVPFQGGWRLDIQCRPEDDAEKWADEETIDDVAATVLGEQYRGRVDWISTYQFKQVVANSFIDDDRRVLLAGEAAHLFAPFGARGMNSGIADAESAASAITVAREAQNSEVRYKEIEDYAAVREKAANWNTQAAKQALKHLQTESPLTKLKKRAAAKVAPFYEPAGKWLDTAPYGPRASPPIATSGKY